MTTVFNYVLLGLMGLCVIVGLFFVIRAVRSRSQSSREAYGVGQQEARQSMQINIARGIAFVFVGLILLGVYGLSIRPSGADFEPTLMLLPTETIELFTATAIPESPSSTPTLSLPAPTIKLTEPITTPTNTAVPEETEIPPTSAPRTATVTSEVGVWLRGSPSTIGEQLEWVLNGTILTLMQGLEEADEFVWQQVRTPDGNEGWVATEFIEIVEP